MGVDIGKNIHWARFANYRRIPLGKVLKVLNNKEGFLKTAIEEALTNTGFKEVILSIPGVGTITAAGFLGNTGDLLRFTHPRQISKLAGCNLTEDSSGENKSKTTFSKREEKR